MSTPQLFVRLTFDDCIGALGRKGVQVMRRYPEYKESGVEWIGEIPVHFEVKRLKYIADLNMGQSPPSEEYNSDLLGTPFLQGNADFGPHHPTPRIYCPTAKKHASPGDILLSVRAPVGAINTADQEYGIGRGLCAIRPRANQLECRYARYLLEVVRTELYAVAIGTTYDAVTVRDVSNITCVVPPLAEQTQIANFLDHKTDRIDELIRIKERQVELLHEYRASLINQTVTKGLDPDVEMKPSGVEWIGEIPAHWKVKPIKHIALFIGGYSEFGSESYTDSGIPIFRIGDIAQSIKMEKVKRVPIQQVKRIKQNQLCHGDTLIVMIGRRAGESTYYAFDYPSILSAQVAGLRAIKVDSKFLFYFIHSGSFLNTVTPLFFGATRDNISKTTLMGVKIPVPPDREQIQIADFLDCKTGQIDELAAIEGRKIELLKEYRQSLISHVVTGKIDVQDEV